MTLNLKCLASRQKYYDRKTLESHDKKHLSYYYQGELSDLGIKVLRICSIIHGGLHNTPENTLTKTDWSNKHHIDITTFYSFSTIDDSRLTQLVLLAHDFKIRVEIKPCNFKYFRILFHQRKKRTGSLFERHPTMERVLKDWRK